MITFLKYVINTKPISIPPLFSLINSSRNVYEGGYKKYENVTFNKVTNTAVTNDGVI